MSVVQSVVKFCRHYKILDFIIRSITGMLIIIKMHTNNDFHNLLTVYYTFHKSSINKINISLSFHYRLDIQTYPYYHLIKRFG